MRKFKLLIALFLCVFALPLQAETTKEIPSDVWLQDKGQKLFEALGQQDISKRYVEVKKLAKEVFDINEFPRLAMGAAWRSFTPAQQEEFKNLFFDYFVVAYSSFSLGEGLDFQIKETRTAGRDIMVRTFVNAPAFMQEGSSETKPSFLEVLFALRKHPSGYYIRDVKVRDAEGVIDMSILMYLRKKLAEKYKQMGSPEALLAVMNKEVRKKYQAAKDLSQIQNKKAY